MEPMRKLMLDKARTRIEGARAFNALETVILDELERLPLPPHTKIEGTYRHREPKRPPARTPFPVSALGETTLIGGVCSVGRHGIQWSHYTFEDLRQKIFGYDFFLTMGDIHDEARMTFLHVCGDSVTQREDEVVDAPYTLGLHESVKGADASRSWNTFQGHLKRTEWLGDQVPAQLAAKIAVAIEQGKSFCRLNEAEALLAMRVKFSMFAQRCGAGT